MAENYRNWKYQATSECALMLFRVHQVCVYFLEQMTSVDKYSNISFVPAEGYCLFIKYYRLTILRRPSKFSCLGMLHCTLSLFTPYMLFPWQYEVHVYMYLFKKYVFWWKKIPHVVSVSLGAMCMYSRV